MRWLLPDQQAQKQQVTFSPSGLLVFTVNSEGPSTWMTTRGLVVRILTTKRPLSVLAWLRWTMPSAATALETLACILDAGSLVCLVTLLLQACQHGMVGRCSKRGWQLLLLSICIVTAHLHDRARSQPLHMQRRDSCKQTDAGHALMLVLDLCAAGFMHIPAEPGALELV